MREPYNPLKKRRIRFKVPTIRFKHGELLLPEPFCPLCSHDVHRPRICRHRWQKHDHCKCLANSLDDELKNPT